jgi:hypothetical protein
LPEWVAPVAVFLVLTAAMAASLDYGDHWDEHQQLGQVASTYASGSFLTHFYNYPSGSYWITLAATVPRALAALAEGRKAPLVRQDELVGPLRIPIRFVFLLVTNLALVWVFLICRRAGAPIWAGLLASLLLGLSFEFAYHSRWIATDGPTAQLVAPHRPGLAAARPAPGGLRRGDRRARRDLPGHDARRRVGAGARRG